VPALCQAPCPLCVRHSLTYRTASVRVSGTFQGNRRSTQDNLITPPPRAVKREFRSFLGAWIYGKATGGVASTQRGGRRSCVDSGRGARYRTGYPYTYPRAGRTSGPSRRTGRPSYAARNQLLLPKWRNLKKSSNNRLTSRKRRTCGKVRTAPMQSRNGSLSRNTGRPKALAHKRLRTGAVAGWRRAGWRGAGNNGRKQLPRTWAPWRNALQRNTFCRKLRVPPKRVVGPRRAEMEKNDLRGNWLGGHSGRAAESVPPVRRDGLEVRPTFSGARFQRAGTMQSCPTNP